MTMPGGLELLVVVAVVLLLFGAKRIPELARSLGGGVRQFREGISGDDGGEEENLGELADGEALEEVGDTAFVEDGRA